MFTGKNKEDFEKWLETQNTLEGGTHFYSFDFRYQNGVYLDYLDSVGVIADVIKTDFNKKFNYEVYKEGTNKCYCKDGVFDTRPEALTEAFKKADELINIKLD